MTDSTLTSASEILLDATAHVHARSWLILGGEAVLALGIAGDHLDASVRWQPIDFLERAAVVNPTANLGIEDPGMTATNIEAVVIVSTPDRDLARRWLLMARQSLASNGRLFIAGANSEGIRPVIGDAKKLFGPAQREDYRSRQRIAVFAGGGIPGDDPAWITESGVEPGIWRALSLELAGTLLTLVTQAGVFASGRVDAGTQLLLDSLPGHVFGRVLDVGCGAGVIGCAAAHLGADAVDMTDVNLLAIQAASESVRRLAGAGGHKVLPYGADPGLPLPAPQVLAGDVYSAVGDAQYDLIVSNPSFHRGKAIDFSMADRLIDEAPDHLAAGGSLLVVANAFLAYGKCMGRVFRQVETLAATRQYQVLRASESR